MKSISQKLQDDIRAIMEAGLHPNQQKIDVHEPEKDEITAHDFKKLRAMKKSKPMKEDPDWVIIEQDEDNTTAKVAGHKVTLHRSLSKPGMSDTYTLHHPSGDKKVTISYDTHGDGEEVHGDKVNKAFGLDSKHKLGHKIAGSMSGMGGISKFEESVEQTNEEEKKKIVSPFDYKNYKSQIPKKPGELTGHDSKKTSTGTVYTKRPVKENTDIDEGSFFGNDKMAKAAQDSGDSKSIVRMRDAKGTYSATMVRKQGEKDHKEISRVYDKKDVKEEAEQIDELSKTTLGSYAKKATRDAVITRKIGADFEHQSKRAKSPGMKAASDELSQKYKSKSWQRRDGVDKAVDRLTKEDVDQNEYTFADYLDAVRAQYGDEDAVLIANEAFKNQDITLFSDQSQSPEA
jgi:hypothetical protein